MDKKNLRRVSVLVTAQTLWHLQKMAGNKKNVGQAIDKLVRKEVTGRG